MQSKKNWRLGVIGSYVPKKCGIATFGRDLIEGMQEHHGNVKTYIAAAETPGETYDYPDNVITTLKTNNRTDYRNAATMFNNLDLDAVVLQHEFGLYGGTWADFEQNGVQHHDPTGDYIFDILDNLTVPVITTLHTVLHHPDPVRRQVVQKIADRSIKVITMSQDSKRILRSKYQIPADKIAVVPHGVPKRTTKTRTELLELLGLNKKNYYMVITGLLSANKGIDLVIKSLPHILEQHPHVRLLVVGQTHPGVIASEGEKYRTHLKSLAKKLDVRHAITFVNKYLPTEKLMQYVSAADAYLTIHRDPEQSTSGTLAYAVGSGKIAISTPYRHAKELLAENRGFLVPFEDSLSIAKTIVRLASDKDLRVTTLKKLQTYANKMEWPAIGGDYLNIINTHIGQPKQHENAIF